MPSPLMAAVEPDAVTDVEPLHGPAQVGFSRFRQQMIMIIHQHVDMQSPPISVHQFGQHFAEMLPISFILEYWPSLIATGCEVIPRAALLNPQCPCAFGKRARTQKRARAGRRAAVGATADSGVRGERAGAAQLESSPSFG